eukprot:NODE_177_length_15815_cov_0.395457.p7 type:complete len:223 gc:universal NODE_177_length_15815_cov_0.395457:3140-2472(-)
MLFNILLFALDYNLGLYLVNQIRTKFNRPPLRISAILNSVADKYAHKMASYDTMGHTVGGTRFDKRIKEGGYPGHRLAENVGVGYDSVVKVIKGWIASPGHLANLMNPSYTEVGLGMAVGKGGRVYWSQEFGDANTQGKGTSPSKQNQEQDVSYSKPRSGTERSPSYTNPYSDRAGCSKVTGAYGYIRKYISCIYQKYRSRIRWICPKGYQFRQGKCYKLQY